jgi:Flp pilus assembly protein TadG
MWGMKLDGRHGRAAREHGAVAVIVSVIVGMGVVMGTLALSVDIGQIMSERRQLQNGADAASMALAQLCANADVSCSTANANAAVKPLANANANDQLTTVSNICASGVAGISATCEAGDAADLGKCQPVPGTLPSGTPYVEVKTQTQTSSGSTVLTPFAKALTNSAGTTVVSCARAAWGPGSPSQITVSSLTMSECDWASQVGYPSTTNYPPPPSGTWPGYSNTDARPDWPTTENTIYSKGNDTTCETSSAGGTAPGGFAWLDGLVSSCTGVVTDSAWIHGDTGADGCDTAMFDPLRGTVIYIPVFDCRMASNPGREPVAGDDCSAGSGSNTWYHISGFAAFYVSGWRLTKGDQVSVRPPNALCGTSSSQRCLSGWFLKNLLTAGEIMTPTTTNPNYGITIVKPAG